MAIEDLHHGLVEQHIGMLARMDQRVEALEQDRQEHDKELRQIRETLQGLRMDLMGVAGGTAIERAMQPFRDEIGGLRQEIITLKRNITEGGLLSSGIKNVALYATALLVMVLAVLDVWTRISH